MFITSSISAPECPEGMEFKACGDACVPTCTDPEGENCGNLGPCTEGCFCKDGLVFNQDGKCVEPDECGCKVPGEDIVIPVRTSPCQIFPHKDLDFSMAHVLLHRLESPL